MVAENLKVIVEAEVNKAIRDLKKAEQQTGKSESGFRRLTKGLASNAAAFLSVGAAVAGVVAIAKESIQLSRRQEDAEARLAGVLRATGEAAGFNQDQLERMASGLQGVTTFGDEAIIEMQSLLLTFKGIQGEGFERTTALSLDLSAAFGQDLKSSALQLGKALEDPATGLTALRRIGVSFTEEQKALIQSLQDAGDVAGAQGVILDVLEGQVGGVAQAMADTASGEAQQFQNAIGDLKEIFGGFLDEALRPVRAELTELVTSMTSLQSIAEDLANTGATVAGAFNSEDYEQLNNALDETQSTMAALRDRAAEVQEQIDNAGFFTSQTKLTQLANERATLQESIAEASAAEAALIEQIEALGEEAANEAARRAQEEQNVLAAQRQQAAEAERILDVIERRNQAEETYEAAVRQNQILLEQGFITAEEAQRRGESAAQSFATALIDIGYDGVGEEVGDQMLRGLREVFETKTEEAVDPMVAQAQAALAMLADDTDFYNERMVQSDEAAAARREQIEKNLQDARSQIITNTFDLYRNLIGLAVQDERKAAIAQKAISIAEATINTAQGITAALSTANIPLATAIGIGGAAQIAAIAAQPIPTAQFGGSFEVPPGANQDGGLVRVNSVERVDVSPARQSGGGMPDKIVVRIADRDFVAAVEGVFNKQGGRITKKGAIQTR
jgi:hypothetical protein